MLGRTVEMRHVVTQMRNAISADLPQPQGAEWNGALASHCVARDDIYSAANGGQAGLAVWLDTLPAVGGQIKRWFDIAAALSAILLLLPLFCLFAIALSLLDPGPVLFRHRRIGRNGRAFYCLKFRTMVTDSDEVLRRHLMSNRDAAREWTESHKLKTDPRITPLGGVLRMTSLDELPQLFNVLRGDMSIVGPRPIVEAEISKYGESIAQYLRARPGLTGLWQVSGRNDVSYRDRIKLDEGYVENWSFARDLLIIIRTFRVIVTRDGCY